MSGPKCNSYSVGVNPRVTEAARLQALAEIGQIELKAKALLTELENFRLKYPDGSFDSVLSHFEFSPTKTMGTRDSAEAYLRNLRRFHDGLRQKIPAAIGRIEAKKQFSKIVSETPQTLTKVADLPRRDERDGVKQKRADVPSQEDRRAQLSHDLIRIIGRVVRADAGTIGQLRNFGKDILAEPSNDRAQSLLDQLRFEVQKLNAQTERRERHAQEATDLIVILFGLTSPALVSLRDELNRVANFEAELTDDLRQRVTRECRAATDRENANYAGEILRDTLQGLGYEVADEGVETLFVEGGMIHLHRPEWKEYYVRMRVNIEEQFMNFNLVRAADDAQLDTSDQRVRDTEKETEWCSKYRVLRRTFEERGIGTRDIRLRPPGEVAVQKVAPKAIGRRARNQQQIGTAPSAVTKNLGT